MQSALRLVYNDEAWVLFLLIWTTQTTVAQGPYEVLFTGPTDKVVAGQRVQLDCTIPDGNHLPVIRLMHNQIPIAKRAGIALDKVQLPDGTYRLGIVYTIDRISLLNVGNYTCEATWRRPARQASATNFIDIVARKINMDIYPRMGVTEAGQSVNLSCNITVEDMVTPTIMVYWYKMSEENASTSIDNSTSGRLIINVTSINQSGLYYCSVLDDFGLHVISPVSNISVLDNHHLTVPGVAEGRHYTLMLPVVSSTVLFALLTCGLGIFLIKRGGARTQHSPKMMLKVSKRKARIEKICVPRVEQDTHRISSASHLEVLEDKKEEPHIKPQSSGTTDNVSQEGLAAPRAEGSSKKIILKPGVYMDMGGGRGKSRMNDDDMVHNIEAAQKDDYIDMRDQHYEEYTAEEPKPTLPVEDYLDPQCSCGAGTYEMMNEADIASPQMQLQRSDASLSGPGSPHQYEGLQRPSSNYEFSMDLWIKENGISLLTAEVLIRERVCTVEDLQELTDQDIRDLSLPIGDRNRLRSAVKRLNNAAP